MDTLSDYLMLLSWLPLANQTYKFFKKQHKFSVVEIFFALSKYSFWAFIAYHGQYKMFCIAEVINVLLAFACLYIYYDRSNNSANIVYNSVIIVNSLWLFNKEKMVYPELICSGLVIASFVASLIRMRKAKEIKKDEHLPSQTMNSLKVQAGLDIMSAIICFLFGLQTMHYSLCVEAALMPPLTIANYSLYKWTLEMNKKK